MVEVGSGLLERQGETPQLRGEPLAHTGVHAREAGPQERSGVVHIQHIQIEDSADSAEAATARGDDDVRTDTRERRRGWHPWPDVPDGVGVVEDEQPTRELPERIVHELPHTIRIHYRIRIQA